MKLIPETTIGKIALFLGLGGLLTIILLKVIGDLLLCFKGVCSLNVDSFWNTISIVIGLIAMLCVISSGILSLIAIIKFKDRSLFIFLPALLGLIGIIFLLGELFIPH